MAKDAAYGGANWAENQRPNTVHIHAVGAAEARWMMRRWLEGQGDVAVV